MNKLIVYTLGLLALSSCTNMSSEEDNRPVAVTVYDKVLLEEEVVQQIPVGSSSEDSVNLRNRIINSWVERQLMIRQAELHLSDGNKDVEKKLEKYRNDLLIYTYQNQLLYEKLDTVVSDEQIQKYYDDNQEMFRLAGYIVKVNYVQLDSNATKANKVAKWLMSSDEDDYKKLEDYCYLHSAHFHLEDNWMYFDQLIKDVPIETYNTEKLLKNKNLIEITDNGRHYLVRIVDYKLKDGISPLSLERPNIRRIILNNRKIEFLENLKIDIYQKAKKNKEIEISIQ